MINVSSPSCCFVSLSLFLSLLLPPGLPSWDLGAAWASCSGPGVCCQHLSKLLQFLNCCCPSCFSCYSTIAVSFKYVFCLIIIMACLYFFSLSPSLYSLCAVSLSFLSFTWPSLSRMVPLCKLGPAQGFILLKECLSLPKCLPGGSGSVKHLETVVL